MSCAASSKRDAPSHARSALRLGILGCANIARQFARDVAGCASVRLVAVASRDVHKAASFAGQFGIPKHHGSYEALLADDGVDAVYIPLPNSLHAAWTMRAAAAGKHVLCEKPLALGLKEAQTMFDVARHHGVVLVESFPYYFQPQTGTMVALLQAGAIGEVRSVQASFGFRLPREPGNIRLQAELGGGALMDAGCYPLSLIRLAFGCAPEHVQADASWGETGVDISLCATLHYSGGRRAQLSCAMDAATHRRATIVGTQGVIETEYLNHTSARTTGHMHGYLPSQLRVRRGVFNNIPFEDVPSGVGSGFGFAAEAFARVVIQGDRAAVERAALASLDNAATLEALASSARQGHAVTLAHRQAGG